MNIIRYYLRQFHSGMWTEFVWHSLMSNNISVRAILSVRDIATAREKNSQEFEDCSCSVPLVLSNAVLFLYEQVTDIRSTQTSGVVTTLTGIPPRNTHS